MKHGITEKLIYSNSMGPNPIKLLEWNLEGLQVKHGDRILDLGSGKGLSSVYLANEYNAEVFAYDKGIDPDKVLKTIMDCNPQKVPVPIKGDARLIPFPSEYFDLVIATDSFIYFGTDDLYMPYISKFIKNGGYLCFTVPAFNKEVEGDASLPEHLRPFWADECWTWHTRSWWKKHVERTGHFEVIVCEKMKDSYEFWKEETIKGPEQWRENDLPVVEKDKGEYMGFVKIIARKVS